MKKIKEFLIALIIAAVLFIVYSSLLMAAVNLFALAFGFNFITYKQSAEIFGGLFLIVNIIKDIQLMSKAVSNGAKKNG